MPPLMYFGELHTIIPWYHLLYVEQKMTGKNLGLIYGINLKDQGFFKTPKFCVFYFYSIFEHNSIGTGFF